MSKFEKELDGILEIIKDEKFYNSKLYALPSIEELKTHFKDWQPPKELVVVPQDMANFIKDGRGKLNIHDAFNKIEVDYGPGTQLYDWVFKLSCGRTLFARAWIDGYTVEKEQMFILKHIDMSKLSADDSLYLTHGMYKRLMHARYSKDVDMSKVKNCHFTQSEIDELNIGSYEQIPVKVDEAE